MRRALLDRGLDLRFSLGERSLRRLPKKGGTGGGGAVLPVLAASGFAQPLLVVEWKAQRLSVSANRALLADVFQEATRWTDPCPLGQLDGSIAVPLLQHSLADADEGVREYVVQSLGGHPPTFRCAIRPSGSR